MLDKNKAIKKQNLQDLKDSNQLLKQKPSIKNDIEINHNLHRIKQNYNNVHKNAHAMDDLFYTHKIINGLNGAGRLQDELDDGLDTKQRKNKIKNTLKYLKKYHYPMVKNDVTDQFTDKPNLKPLKHNDLKQLAKETQQTMQYEPNAYKIIAHVPDDTPSLKGEHVNIALRNLVNYGINHHQMNTFKKHHLAETRSVQDSEMNLNQDVQDKIDKQLANIKATGIPHIRDVVKINTKSRRGVVTDMNVSAPTAKDVDGVVKGMHAQSLQRSIKRGTHQFKHQQNMNSNIPTKTLSKKHFKRNQRKQNRTRNQGLSR